jgi:hypothetical protein
MQWISSFIIKKNMFLLADPPKCDPKASPVFGKPLQNNTAFPGQIGENMTIICLVSFGKKCGFSDYLTGVKWIEVVNDTCAESVFYQSEEKKE